MNAKEIVDAMMQKHLTNHELTTKFGIDLDKADRIGRLSAYAFGPDGKGYAWYVKQVEKTLGRKTPMKMDAKNLVASELVKVAKLLVSAPVTHRFTKMVPVKLVPEGSTRMSLQNAQAIKDAGYEFQSGITYYNNEKANYETVVMFSRGNETVSWTFKGFSAGYSGEGPRGLVEFGQIFNVPIKSEIVMDREYLMSRNFLDGNGVNLGEYY